MLILLKINLYEAAQGSRQIFVKKTVNNLFFDLQV